MHQIKLFKGIESEIPTLERDVNAWLRDSGAKVVQIFGNMSPQTAIADAHETKLGRAYTPSDVFLAVLYEAAP